MGEDPLDRASLGDPAGVHHEDIVAHLCDYAEVVGDEQDGGAELGLEVAQEIDRLARAMQRAKEQLQEVRERLAELGFEPNRNTPAAFAELIKTDIQKWGRVVRESGARVD